MDGFNFKLLGFITWNMASLRSVSPFHTQKMWVSFSIFQKTLKFFFFFSTFSFFSFYSKTLFRLFHSHYSWTSSFSFQIRFLETLHKSLCFQQGTNFLFSVIGGRKRFLTRPQFSGIKEFSGLFFRVISPFFWGNAAIAFIMPFFAPCHSAGSGLVPSSFSPAVLRLNFFSFYSGKSSRGLLEKRNARDKLSRRPTQRWLWETYCLKRLHQKEPPSRPVGLSFLGLDVLSLSYSLKSGR